MCSIKKMKKKKLFCRFVLLICLLSTVGGGRITLEFTIHNANETEIKEQEVNWVPITP